jgi:hypothetical protein
MLPQTPDLSASRHAQPERHPMLAILIIAVLVLAGLAFLKYILTR